MKSFLEGCWVYNYKPTREDVIFYSYMRFSDNNTYNTFVWGSTIETFELDHKKEVMEWSYSEKDSLLTLYTVEFKVLAVKNDSISLLRLDDVTKPSLYKHPNCGVVDTVSAKNN